MNWRWVALGSSVDTGNTVQEHLYGKEIVVADREMVESQIEVILKDADREDVAFLVVGDPFGYAAFTVRHI